MILEIILTILGLIITKQYFRGSLYIGVKPNLKGKVAVITGGNAGIGKSTALDLVKQGCYVIIGCRDTKKSEKVVEEIKLLAGSEKINQFYLDLGSKKSIEEFVANIKFQKIDFLVNNAGVMDLPAVVLTEQKHQMQYGVNHLGHFYLTSLLMDKLKKSQQFRIINVSSEAHRRIYSFLKETTLDFDNMSFQNIPYSRPLAYSRSKLYNVLFAKALASKIPEGAGFVGSLHPGVVRTDITRYMSTLIKILKTLVHPIYYLLTKSAEQGAQTTLYLLYSNLNELQNGGYYSDCSVRQPHKLVTQQNWEKLWNISERDLNIKFNL